MHVIIDVHSPGGVNGMPFSEAYGHYRWFNSQTTLDCSLAAIDAVLAYVQSLGHPECAPLHPSMSRLIIET